MINKRKNKVVIGGTFDVLHKGHNRLLKKAFSLGEMTIGLTSDEMAEKIKKRKVNIFPKRKKELIKFIKDNFSEKYQILKIKDKFGPTIKKDFDFIVVSPATYANAVLINQERQKLGRSKIKIIKIKFVLAANGQPISASQIIAGRLDKNGRLIKKK